jgi:thiol reductant ABC exporter CydC subunit
MSSRIRDRPLARLIASGRPASGRLVLGILAAAGALAASLGLAATAAWLIARASQRPSVLTLAVAVAAVQLFGMSRPVFRYLGRLITHDAAFRIVADFRARVYARLIDLAPARLGRRHRGEVLAGLVSDVDAIQDLELRIIEPAAVAVLVSLISVSLSAALFPSAGVVLAAGLLVAGVVAPMTAAATLRRSTAALAPARAALSATVVDLVQGAPDLIAVGAMKRQLQLVDERDAELTRLARRSAWATGAGAGLAVLAAGATVWGAAVVATPAVHQGRLSGVLLAVIVLLPLAAFEALAPLPQAAVLVHGVRSAATRLFGLLDEPPAVQRPVLADPFPETPYSISLRGAGARWTPDGPLILRGLDLTLRPGDHVAVTGASGSGKSTLAALLLRFVDPADKDTLLLNGVDVCDLAADDLRRVIGYVAGDAHIFCSNLRENLRLARPDATDVELVSALRRVQLGAWYDQLPAGLATMLGERGALISGGECRRIALARALLADQLVLVLDEPTEGLDVPTATAVMDELLDIMRGRTVLLLTHRPEGLARMDRVYQLVNGRLVTATTVATPRGRTTGDRPQPVRSSTRDEDRVRQLSAAWTVALTSSHESAVDAESR